MRISVIRQLQVRYRGSSLGVLWAFVMPLFMTALYATLFGTALSSYYGGSVVRYVLSVFVAVVVVTFFTQATSEALGSVVYNGGLLNKIALDPETFPIASVAANAFQQAITTFPLMVLLSIVISHDPIRIVLTPIALLAFIGLVTGLALALSSAFVFFRDTVNIWAVAGFLLWMTSPVFYPAALVPARIQPWFAVNPVALSIAALREVTLGRGPIDVLLLVKFFVASLMILAFGHLIFISVRRKFMDLL